MARRGGNVMRAPDSKPDTSVPNESRTLLNLLKTLPGIFGELPNDQAERIDPAILFFDDDQYGCYFNPEEVPATRPHAHRALAESQGISTEDVIRAYLVGTNIGKLLFPSAHDLTEKGHPEGSSLEDKLTVLNKEFAGRASVELGGASKDGKSSDLVPIALWAQRLLADSHGKGLDFVETERHLEAVLDVVLVD